MAYEYKFFIGCNDKDTKKDNYKEIKKRVIEFFTAHYDAFTMQESTGYYTHDRYLSNTESFGGSYKRITVLEKSLIVTYISSFKLKCIENNCKELKQLCNQETIMVTKRELDVQFV